MRRPPAPGWRIACGPRFPVRGTRPSACNHTHRLIRQPPGSDGLWDNLYFHEAAGLVRGAFVAAEAAAAAQGCKPRRQSLDVAAAAAAAVADDGGDDSDASSTQSCLSERSLGRTSSSSSLSSVDGGCGERASGERDGNGAPAAGRGPAWPAPQAVAEALASAAKANSTDPQYVSSFGLVDRAIR